MNYCCISKDEEEDKQERMAQIQQKQVVNKQLCLFDKSHPFMPAFSQLVFYLYCDKSAEPTDTSQSNHCRQKTLLTKSRPHVEILVFFVLLIENYCWSCQHLTQRRKKNPQNKNKAGVVPRSVFQEGSAHLTCFCNMY